MARRKHNQMPSTPENNAQDAPCPEGARPQTNRWHLRGRGFGVRGLWNSGNYKDVRVRVKESERDNPHHRGSQRVR